MIKSKDILNKNVYDTNNKKIGILKDIFIDLYRGNIEGVDIFSYFSFKKNLHIKPKDIIKIKESIIANKVFNECIGFRYSEIKDMEILDTLGQIKGNIEDILIDEVTFKIKGFVITPGILEKIIRGKEVILLKDIIIDEDYIIYKDNSNIKFKNILHEEMKNEHN